MRNVRTQYPKSLRYEIVCVYLTGNNSYEELANIYKVPITNIRTWVIRYRYSKNVVSLQAESQPVEDMARKKKDAEKSADVLALEARIRELELQNLALNTLIDVAEKNGIDIRKMTRVCRLIPNFASDSILCCKHFQENVNETRKRHNAVAQLHCCSVALSFFYIAV